MKRNAALVPVVTALVINCAGLLHAQTLEKFASFPADTFAPGPTSGQFIAPANNRVPPFADAQPVQGISSVLKARNGDYLVMSDNGFGAKDNSQDYVLRMYRIDPSFRTRRGGPGTIDVRSFITLSDPNRHINFEIVADREFYPGNALVPDDTIPVDEEIRSGRLLTGGDFDIESVREAPDGTFWFGDEFGPFLIHTDSRGRVLQEPIPLPGVKSPQNPFLMTGETNLPRSKGFEGMAISPDGKTLYPMLEGALTPDLDQSRLIINEFDLRKQRYTGTQWFYHLDPPLHAIGDFTALSKRRFLVIERDNEQGAAAAFKKIFVVDLKEGRRAGLSRETPRRRSAGHSGSAQYRRTGSRVPLSVPDDRERHPDRRRHAWRADDNNYPFSSARTPGEPI